MKLRTKVILTCMITLVCALAIANIVICLVLSDSYRNEAMVKSYQRTHTLVEDYKERFNLYNPDSRTEHISERSAEADQIDESVESSEIDYFFKTYSTMTESSGNEIGYICLSKDPYSTRSGEHYNNTVLDSKLVCSLKYRNYIDMQYTTYKYKGNEYVIFTSALGKGGKLEYTIYQIENISYVWSKLDRLIVILVCCSIIITTMTLSILLLILRRILHPLQELNESTKSIANNVYDKRVNVTTKDEIGELGVNFNKMAEAIARYTESLEESEKKKTMFMGNLTHELKTPMTAMCGYSQLLLTAMSERLLRQMD